jgi:electron transfer flavoprotein beta subunit
MSGVPCPASSPLSIVVLLEFCVDAAQLRADPATGLPELATAARRIDPFSENAIEAAVRLREVYGGHVLGLCVAREEPPRECVLRALAMGLDELRIIRVPAEVADAAALADPCATATILAAAIVAAGGIDLVLAGEASSDGYNAQVGPRVAEALDLPAVCAARELCVEGRRLRAERVAETALELVELDLPALVTVGSETNQPRLPTVLQIMGAGRKPTTELTLGQLGLAQSLVAGVATVRVAAPPSARRRAVVEGESAALVARALLRMLGEAGEANLR